MLAEKSETEKARIWEIVAKTGVDEDDPIFLIMVAIGTIETAVIGIPQQLAVREKILQQKIGILNEKIESLEAVASDIVNTSTALQQKLKTQIPEFQKQNVQSKLMARKLAGGIAVAFLAGTLFGAPVLKLIANLACETTQICAIANSSSGEGGGNQ